MGVMQHQFGGILDGKNPLLPGMYWLIRLSMVVLPVPVPPLTIMLRRDSTARMSTSRQASVMEPLLISSRAVRWLRVNFRILMVGPSSASGG